MSSAFDIKPNNGLSIGVVVWWSPPPPCHVPFMKKNLHNKTQVCPIVIRICHSLASSCLPFTPPPPIIQRSALHLPLPHRAWIIAIMTIIISSGRYVKAQLLRDQERRMERDGNYTGWINIYRQNFTCKIYPTWTTEEVESCKSSSCPSSLTCAESCSLFHHWSLTWWGVCPKSQGQKNQSIWFARHQSFYTHAGHSFFASSA